MEQEKYEQTINDLILKINELQEKVKELEERVSELESDMSTVVYILENEGLYDV